MMKCFIDTNVFLRVLIKEDEKSFRECYHLLELIQRKRISAFTSSLIFAEIDWVIESFYKLKREEAVKSLESISKLRGLKMLNGVNIALAIELYKRYNVKFIDALIASIPQIFQKRIAVVSYDRDFDKLQIKRLEPQDVLKRYRYRQ